MKTSSFRFKTALFVVLSIIACKRLHNIESKDVIQKILIHVKGEPIISKNIGPKKFADALGLIDIRKGYDSFAIRVWRWDPDNMSLIEIRTKNGICKAQVFQFGFEKIEEGDSTWILLYEKRENVKPKAGWQKVINYLHQYNINTLPDLYPIIQKEQALTGGIYYQFEVATAESYRNYGYLEPFYLRRLYPEAEQAAKILEFLNDQFDLPPLDKGPEPTLR